MPAFVLRLLRARDAEEARRAMLAAALFFSVICGYLVAKPVRNALFLNKRRFDDQPAFYLLTAVVMFAVGIGVNLAAARWRPRQLVAGGFVGFALVFVSFGAWLAAGLPYGAEAFLVWVSVYNLLAVYFFWALANDRFTPEQGTRLYGPIGAGGVLGSIVGSYLAGLLARPLGSENLVFVVAGFQVLCLALVLRLTEEAAPPAGSSTPASSSLAAGTEGLRAIARSDFLQKIFGIVLLVTFVGTILEFRFSEIVQAEITGKDDKTRFFGLYFGLQNVLAFLFQVLAVAPLAGRWGPAPGLLALVAMQGVAALGLGGVLPTGGAGALPLAQALLLPCGALFYSLHQSSRELLYTPLSREEKYKAKVFADTFGFRLGDAVASVAQLANRFLLAEAALRPAALALLTLPLIAARGWLSVRASRRYRELAAKGAEFKVNQ
ncbi:MAG: hypothetical protein HYZ53_20150 [Planctomycetes bacterium]|nr:hypothetical protein [Planctomycetota bacterium]